MSMNIYSKPGSKVVFLNKNGYDSDRKYAVDIGLIEGKEYIIDRIEVGEYYSSVKLIDFPLDYFNTVMFDDYKEVETPSKEYIKIEINDFLYYIRSDVFYALKIRPTTLHLTSVADYVLDLNLNRLVKCRYELKEILDKFTE